MNITKANKIKITIMYTILSIKKDIILGINTNIAYPIIHITGTNNMQANSCHPIAVITFDMRNII